MSEFRVLGLKVFPTNFKGPAIRLSVFFTLVLLSAYFFQEHLLHHPDRYDRATLTRRLSDEGLIGWPSAENFLGALSDSPSPNGSIVIFHGNAGSALDRGFYAESLIPLGFRVFLYEYPSYGPREGNIDEDSITIDAVAATKAVLSAFGRPLFVFGESLGSGVASAVAGKLPNQIDGLVLITPWDNLPNVAQSLYWFLPVRWLVRDNYDSIANLKVYHGPVVVVRARGDEIIPERGTNDLYASLSGRKKILTVSGKHNTWYGDTDSKWWKELSSFLLGQ